MDIGQTIRSFTVEPLRSPVPPLRIEPEPAVALEKERAFELTAPRVDVPFDSLIPPSLSRRFG
jgi:hypothetical protein